jgi:hypothetical protein
LDIFKLDHKWQRCPDACLPTTDAATPDPDLVRALEDTGKILPVKKK